MRVSEKRASGHEDVMTRFMTRASTRVLGVLLPMATLCWTATSDAAVVWTATFEAGDLSEWQPGVNEKKGDRVNAEASGDEAYRGSKAGKIVVHPDDTFTFNQNRVDIQHPSSLTDEGEDMWLSGHYLMPEDAKVRNEIGFFESNESYQNVMDFWVEPKNGGGTSINFGVGFLGATKLWTADFTPGVWHQIAIHVLWSTDAQKGSVDVWFDGIQVVTAHKAKTKADENTLFFQTGLHRKDIAQVTETIYFDELIEADTQAEVKIAAPSMDPPAGGAGGGGAGGAAGMAGAAVGGAFAGGGGSSASGTAGAAGHGTTMAGASSAIAGASSAGSSATAPLASTDDPSCSVGVTGHGKGRSLAFLTLLLAAIGCRRRRSQSPGVL